MRVAGDWGSLLSLSNPVIGVASEVARLDDVAARARDDGLRLLEVNGANAKTVDALFDEFAEKLEFPDYFGRNWAAFDECIADLEWLPAGGYLLIIRNAAELLSRAPGNRRTLFEILVGAAAEWAEPVEQGEYWDRPGRVFAVVLAGDSGDLVRMLAAAGVDESAYVVL